MNKQSYENYLDEYWNSSSGSSPQIASIDLYLKYCKLGTFSFFYNLDIFNKKANGRPMWGIVDTYGTNGSVSSFQHPGTDFDTDESYTRFSANTYLAYGVKGIVYFAYDTKYEANWGLVKSGVKGDKYDWAKDINMYIKNVVGDKIMSSEYLGTYHKSHFYDKDGTLLETIDDHQLINVADVPYLDDISHPKSMVGMFYDKTNKYVYLYVVNKGFLDDHGDISVAVYLKADQRGKIETWPTTGPNWDSVSVSSSYIAGRTRFVVGNLKPGEGRLYRINFSNILTQPSISVSGGYGDNPILTFSGGGAEVEHYILKKEYDFGSGFNPHFVDPASNPYTDTNVEISKYGDLVARYSVKAVDFLGYESSYSNTVSKGGQSLWKNEDMNIDDNTVESYGLQNNHPNPFNPSTVITYQVPKDGIVQISVYNSLGQKVTELVNEFKTKGKYSAQFHSNDLPSGIYFYQMNAGSFNDVKKMLLVK